MRLIVFVVAVAFTIEVNSRPTGTQIGGYEVAGVAKPGIPGNVDLLSAINLTSIYSTSIMIETDVEAQFKKLTDRDAEIKGDRNYVLFRLSILKESISEVLTRVKNLEEKLRLLANEIKLRKFVARLLSSDNYWASTDAWLGNKGTEITEETALLIVHYNDLLNLYRNHLKATGGIRALATS